MKKANQIESEIVELDRAMNITCPSCRRKLEWKNSKKKMTTRCCQVLFVLLPIPLTKLVEFNVYEKVRGFK